MADGTIPPAIETLRQRITRWLTESEHSFDDLRIGLQLAPHELEEELRHIERSVRKRGMRLVVQPPLCRNCGFDFPGRTHKHLHPPSRCPECKEQRIEPPRFRVV